MNNLKIEEFDEQFFNKIAVPMVKDYSRLSSSPTRDMESDSSYFSKNREFPVIECDTPVKVQMERTNRENEEWISTTDENFLTLSLPNENSTDQSNTDVVDTIVDKSQEKKSRDPLKIVPEEKSTINYTVEDSIDDLSKLQMFGVKKPEERLAQRRRSEQKKREEEANKNKVTPGTGMATTRGRSISTNRSASRKSAETKIPVGKTSRESSLNRGNTPTNRVVTRSMAKASTNNDMSVRRSVLPKSVPIRIVASTTPSSEPLNTLSNRSRDRTRRSNTSGVQPKPALTNRKSVLPVGTTRTPITTPQRATSLTRGKSGTASRPIATANRSSTLRMNAMKATRNSVLADSNEIDNKNRKISTALPTGSESSRTACRVPITNRTRQPIKVNPATPLRGGAKTPMAANRFGKIAIDKLKSSAVRSSSTSKISELRTEGTVSASKNITRKDSEALFLRLSKPKTTPLRMSTGNAGNNSNLENREKSAVRPVPEYVRNFTKSGLPTSGGLHGLRAPSRTRNEKGSTQSLNTK